MSLFLSTGLDAKLKHQWLLWDTCAIIRIAEIEGASVFEYLDQFYVRNATIRPVLLELFATADKRVAAERAVIVEQHMVSILPLNIDSKNDKTSEIQALMPRGSQPGAVDLMVGSTLAQYSKSGKRLMITENVKDFPEPLFQREGVLSITNEQRTASLTVLSVDLGVLH